MTISFIVDEYYDFFMMLMLLSIIALTVLKAYFSRERLRTFNNYSTIIRNSAALQRRLELIMLELENLPLDTHLDESFHSRSVSKALVETLPHIDANEEGHCSVCLDVILCEQKVTILPCTHRFHSTCVDKWLLIKAICPICKTRIN
jgi:hypothetical protein